MKEASIQSLFQVTEVELIYRNKLRPEERPEITSAEKAYTFLMSVWDINKIELVEHMKILLLDRRSRCIGISEISTGGINDCLCDPKIVFATALKARASALILSHNHPSGIVDPSQADINLTHKLVFGGRLLDINVLDHLIVAPHTYYSFAKNDLIFS